MKLGRWSSREDGLRKKKAWGEKVDSYLLIKAVNIERLPTSIKTRLFPRGRANGTVGLPKPIFIKIP